jgi:hypothetical protein
MPGRLTTSARRWTLHLPESWPWQDQFELMLSNLRAVEVQLVALRR